MTPRPPRAPHATPMRYGSRYAPPAPSTAPVADCPRCAAPLPSARARYCSDACKQRAYRLRQGHTAAAVPVGLTTRKRVGNLVAAVVYECPTCEARYLGERRCPDCHRFCRNLGPGGACPHCDEPVLLAELLGPEVLP
jgi:hypothetical protein